MMCVVDFNMIVEINRLLKNKGIDYSVHSIGSCASCGLELKSDGKEISLEYVIEIINEYLGSKWLKVKQSQDNAYILYVESKFDVEKR